MKYMTVQTSDEVDLAALQIDPEETKLGKLELPAEPEPEESREKQLGLIDPGPDAPRDRRPVDEEFVDEEGGERADRDRGERPEATEAAAEKPKPDATEGS